MEKDSRKWTERSNDNDLTSHASFCTKEIGESERRILGIDYDYLGRADGNVHKIQVLTVRTLALSLQGSNLI